ncbi:hypothetical protein [Legionella quateirensis]|uniref:Uncharacterized protein n=1 Tax=Legionella quateirensis TaxID=45072 RepID=A0A378KX16_9GAMM|nr:hypothetical protein [Legionella quateirensis]KTD43262.1 hypothetical protein Lqua_3163 [Legionella quateirensis]STY18141.1 Uncharacterised protein [Legionella quateirensis]
MLSKQDLQRLFDSAQSEMFREPVLKNKAPQSLHQLTRAIDVANRQYEAERDAQEPLAPMQMRLKINAQAVILAYLELEAYDYYNRNVNKEDKEDKEDNEETYLDVFKKESGNIENIKYYIVDYVKKCDAIGDQLFVQWVKGIFTTADAALTDSDSGELERERRIDDLFNAEESNEYVAGMDRP